MQRRNRVRHIVLLITTLIFIGCNGVETQTPSSTLEVKQDIQVFSSPNKEHTITPKSIERVFERSSFKVDGNNNMNRPFSMRFQETYYKTYHLAMFFHRELSFRLLKKYPKFGVLIPLTMSIWEDEKGNMNISTLSLEGMSRATQIPIDDVDLVEYASLLQEVLQKAMPNGKMKQLSYTPAKPSESFQIHLTQAVDFEDGSAEDFIDDYEAEFEGEMETKGFLFPNFTNVAQELFKDHNYTNVYDFYHTYSICKFEVIFPVSKKHPEAGAWAPCSFYIYKKVDEEKMHIGFLGVENWISSLDIEDNESIEPLYEAQQNIIEIIKGME